jgi:hypothetical protein
VDKQGNRYKRVQAEGHGGVGYTQVTVVWLDADRAVLDVRVHNMARVGGPSLEVTSEYIVASPGIGGDWWVNPTVLRQVPQQRYRGARILRMPYRVGGRTYNAIRFQMDTGGSEGVHVYDLDSGILLHSSSETGFAATLGWTKLGGHAGRQGKILGHATLQGMRQLSLPWSNAQPPAWTARVNSIKYQGEHSVQIPGQGSRPIHQPGGAETTITQRGPGWLVSQTNYAFYGLRGMPPARFQSKLASGAGSLCGLWIAPVALARLRQGQVLDRDHFSGQATVVERTGNPVIISQRSRMETMHFGYDRNTGMLVFFKKQIPSQFRWLRLQMKSWQ